MKICSKCKIGKVDSFYAKSRNTNDYRGPVRLVGEGLVVDLSVLML